MLQPTLGICPCVNPPCPLYERGNERGHLDSCSGQERHYCRHFDGLGTGTVRLPRPSLGRPRNDMEAEGGLGNPHYGGVGAGAPTYPIKDAPFDRLRANG